MVVDILGIAALNITVINSFLDIGAIQGHEWGWTKCVPGGGLLGDHFPKSNAKAIWDFEGIYAVSRYNSSIYVPNFNYSFRHVPGVRFPGMIHPGVVGCAPSHGITIINPHISVLLL